MDNKHLRLGAYDALCVIALRWDMQPLRGWVYAKPNYRVAHLELMEA